MGHCEMLLAVAGLKEEELSQRVGVLATGDWSGLPPAERLALRFACKLTREPAAVSDKDVRLLAETFGPHRAVDLIYRTAGCNYMTRVADAFQLPLEPTNVFMQRQKDKEKGPGPGKDPADRKKTG